MDNAKAVVLLCNGGRLPIIRNGHRDEALLPSRKFHLSNCVA